MLEIKVKRNLTDFNLDVEINVDKEILSILGPSGSGKTMTLMCIAGLLHPDEGLIRLNGKVLFDSKKGIFMPPQKRKIGFVFQNYALFPHLTVAENIAYGIHDKPKKFANDRIKELLEIIHIPGLINRYPNELSSGQQQRVALARAIAPEPEVLLLDEPFSALDTFRRERLEYELLNLYQYFEGDILFVTHDLDQGFKLGNRIAIFENGRVIQCEAKEEVIANPENITAAKMLGVKNLLSGRITEIDEGGVSVLIPEFGMKLKAVGTISEKLSPDQPVLVGIRPEHIELKDFPGINTLSCISEQVLDGVTNFHSFYYAVNDAVKRYRLERCSPRSSSIAVHPEGENYCYLYFPPERLIVLAE
ncbi:MAG: ABC transporter ATP-binding protein [Bacillota bacterium]|nr:ABC transporter ATP-binding protein [Bacillota bacterium]